MEKLIRDEIVSHMESNTSSQKNNMDLFLENPVLHNF